MAAVRLEDCLRIIRIVDPAPAVPVQHPLALRHEGYNVLFFYRTARDSLSVYLPGQQGTGPDTVSREALNLLIEYVRDAEGKALEAVSFQCLSGESIAAFL